MAVVDVGGDVYTFAGLSERESNGLGRGGEGRGGGIFIDGQTVNCPSNLRGRRCSPSTHPPLLQTLLDCPYTRKLERWDHRTRRRCDARNGR